MTDPKDPTLDAATEMGFNDTELQDIMDEIESLEKEFVTTDESASDAVALASTEMPELSKEELAVLEELDGVDDIDQVDAQSLSLAPEEIKRTDLQSSIDDEVEVALLSKEIEEVSAGIESVSVASTSASEDVDNVISMPIYDSKKSSTVEAAAPVSMSATGQMCIDLKFQVGDEEAVVKVSQSGVTVCLSGVEMTIDQTQGCTVEMAGGIKFNVPLHSLNSAKKAA